MSQFREEKMQILWGELLLLLKLCMTNVWTYGTAGRQLPKYFIGKETDSCDYETQASILNQILHFSINCKCSHEFIFPISICTQGLQEITSAETLVLFFS